MFRHIARLAHRGGDDRGAVVPRWDKCRHVDRREAVARSGEQPRPMNQRARALLRRSRRISELAAVADVYVADREGTWPN